MVMTSKAAITGANSLYNMVIRADTLIRRDIVAKKEDIGLPSAGLSLGTQGIGIEAQIPLAYRWQLRAGATLLPFKASGDYMSFPSRSVVTDLDANLAKVHVVAEWEPFPFSPHRILQKFVLSGGLSYFISAKGTAKMKLKDPYYYGDIEISQDEVGELKVSSNWNGLAPYVGIGLNRLKIANRVNMNISTGVFYMSSPSVQITGTNMLSDNSQNQGQLKSNLDKYYRWLPTLQFSFNYTIKTRR